MSSSSNNPTSLPIPPTPNNPNTTIIPTSPVTAQSPSLKKQVFFSKSKSVLKKASRKLFNWFIFTVIIGLMPITISIIFGNFDHKLSDVFNLFIHGELLIICFALAADAMGDLVSNKKMDKGIGYVLFGLCIVWFTLSGFVFAGLTIVASYVDVEKYIDKQDVGIFSIYMLIATLLTSMSCKILTEA